MYMWTVNNIEGILQVDMTLGQSNRGVTASP